MKRFFRLAKKVAIKKKDRRKYKVGAVGIRNDGTIVKSSNVPCKVPEPTAHAEVRLARKLTKGSIVYIVRVNSAYELCMARPCANCLRVLIQKEVKRIYYSITNEEYGVIILNQ